MRETQELSLVLNGSPKSPTRDQSRRHHHKDGFHPDGGVETHPGRAVSAEVQLRSLRCAALSGRLLL